MKKLAILLPAMRIGGAEKNALDFIKELKKYYEVTLILNKKEGELLESVPAGVNIIEDPLVSFQEIIKNDLKKLKILRLLQDAIYYIKLKIGKRKEKNYRYLISRTPKIKGDYDIAIGYVANVSTQIFCLADRICARKKVAWIPGETNELMDVNLFGGIFKKFDKIFAVSEVTKKHFVEKFPCCTSITDVYYNSINKKEILQKANHPKDCEFDKDVFNIVSVGRVTPEKGFDMIPHIAKLLKEGNYRFHWYLVGDGPCLPMIREQINMLNLDNEISLLGAKSNPYPYMKDCDVYVQPSYEEGYSTTICEAGILGKAIIGTTTSGGIREQIEENVTGLISEPTPEEMSKKIEELITNTDKRMLLGKNISLIDFSNKDEIKKMFFSEV